MSLKMELWKVVDSKLEPLSATNLENEQLLESWIASEPSTLGIDLLLIGRQVSTVNRGRIDLLAIDQQGDLVIIELKRGRTAREIVAQLLDYASWVKSLDYQKISNIAEDFLGTELHNAFQNHYAISIPENINTNHKMLIVATDLDESTQRIVEYLVEEYDVNINVVLLSYFNDGQTELLARAWLLDPEEVQDRVDTRKKAPWSGYWFVNVGEDNHRNWDDNVKYGYIGAGHGEWYSKRLSRLKKDDKIFAYMKELGYVGYGVVLEESVMIKDFEVDDKGETLLDLDLQASEAKSYSDDPNMSEWAVKINWLKTFQREKAKTFRGAFANQNIVCKLRQQQTVEFLEREFSVGSNSE